MKNPAEDINFVDFESALVSVACAEYLTEKKVDIGKSSENYFKIQLENQ